MSATTNVPQQKIIQDIRDCVAELKSEFEESKIPIDDDNQTLHRFCAKLEFLLQAHMKERVSVLGRKKDYWDYLQECLRSNKGSTDGVKYVKTLSEYKTSIGKGRALIRFCLMHRRLADTIQQCTVNGKITSDWYLPKSVWLQHDLSSLVIEVLYDLTDLQFDLVPRGYDLDNSWPSFAKKTSGGYNWNPPSRTSSISSLASIPDGVARQMSFSSTPNQNSHLPESVHSDVSYADLLERNEALEQQKFSLQQAIAESRGELDALHNQYKQIKTEHLELDKKYKELEKVTNCSALDLERKTSEWKIQESEHHRQLDSLKEENEKLKSQLIKLDSETDSLKNAHETSQKTISETQSDKAELSLQIKSLKQDLEISQQSETRKSESIAALENKIVVLEKKNDGIMGKLESVLVESSGEASSKLDVANKLHDLLGNLKQAEEMNLQHHAKHEELKSQNSLLTSDLEQTKNRLEDNEKTYESELLNLKNRISELENQITDSEEQLKNEKEMLASQMENYEQIIRDKETKITEQVTENEQLQNKLGEKEKLNEGISADISELKSVLEATKSEHRKKEIEMNKNREELDREKFELTKQNEILENELCSSKTSLESHKNSIEAMKKESEKLLSQVDDLTAKNCQFQDAWSQLNSELEATVEKQNLQHSTTEETKVMLSEKTSRIQSLELELQRLCQAITWLRDRREQVDPAKMTMDLQDKDASDALGELTNHLGNVNAKLAEADDRLQQLNTEVESFHKEQFRLEKEIESYKKRVSDMDKQIVEINEWANKMETYTLDIEKDLQDEKTYNSCLKQDLDKTNTKANNLAESNQELKSENSRLSKTLSEKLAELAALNAHMQKSKTELQMLVQTQEHSEKDQNSLKEQLQVKSKLVEDKEKLIKHLEDNDLNSRDLIINLSKDKKKLTSDNHALIEKCASISAKMGEMQKEVQHISDKLKDSENKVKEVSENNSSLKENIKKLERNAATLKLEKETLEARSTQALSNCESERDEMYRHVEEALRDTQDINEQMKWTKSQLELVCDEKTQLEKERVTLLFENSKLENVVAEMKKRIENLGSDVKSVNDSLVENEKKISELVKENEQLLDDKKNLKKEAIDLNSCKNEELTSKNVIIEDLETRISELEEKLEKVLHDNKTEEKSFQLLSVELHNVQKERDQLKSEVLSLGTDVTDKIEAIGKLDASSRQLQEKVSQLEGSLGEKADTVSQMEVRQEELTRNYSNQIESLQQEVSSLHFQFSTEKLQLEETIQKHAAEGPSVSELRDELLTRDTIIEQLETKLEQTRSDLERERDEFVRDTEVWRRHSENQQQELEDEKTKASEQVNQKAEEISLLKHDITQMKKKLIKLIKEKDTLWQRQDSLTYQQKLKASDKWEDDSKVTNCLGCKAEFSFTLRKHHCRLCGKIFCHNCSDNWIMTPHSSKECRVCNFCEQRQNSKDTAADSSFLSAISDSDEEDATGENTKQPQKKLFYDMESTASSVSDIETDPTSTSVDADSVGDAPLSTIPGQVISNLTISLVDGTDVNGVKRRSTEDVIDRGDAGTEGSSEESNAFHVISDDEIAKSRSGSDEPPLTYSDPNMTCSVTLSANDLEKDQVNHTNEVMVKAGKSHAIPIQIDRTNTLLCWEFSSQPKDVMFSIDHHAAGSTGGGGEVQTLIPPHKCDSHKQTVRGEMTVQQPGIYTLIFDNTYSRLTSKKVSYSLWAKTDFS